jgi:hypothetical protein
MVRSPNAPRRKSGSWHSTQPLPRPSVSCTTSGGLVRQGGWRRSSSTGSLVSGVVVVAQHAAAAQAIRVMHHLGRPGVGGVVQSSVRGSSGGSTTQAYDQIVSHVSVAKVQRYRPTQ